MNDHQLTSQLLENCGDLIGQDKSGKCFSSGRQLTCLRVFFVRLIALSTNTFCDTVAYSTDVTLNSTCNTGLAKTQLTNNMI